MDGNLLGRSVEVKGDAATKFGKEMDREYEKAQKTTVVHVEKIHVTKQEAMEMLKHLSRIDGYLMGIDKAAQDGIHEQLDYPVTILFKALMNAK